MGHVERAGGSRDGYRGQVIAFGTQHGKQDQVAPAFARLLDARVTAPPGLDTDRFGTFTGEVPRALPPREAARAKARLAMTAASTPFGLASEGSYGALPGVGLPGHEELLLFVDDTRGIEVLEGERTLSDVATSLPVETLAQAAPFLTRIGFPGQGVIVRPDAGGGSADIRKGISDPGLLARAIEVAAGSSRNGRALLQPDLRAHHNPGRRTVLARLGRRLATRLATECPLCHCPGHGPISTRIGLPCAACRWPTDSVLADVHGCPRCPHRETRPRPETTAEPRWCDRCNP